MPSFRNRLPPPDQRSTSPSPEPLPQGTEDLHASESIGDNWAAFKAQTLLPDSRQLELFHARHSSLPPLPVRSLSGPDSFAGVRNGSVTSTDLAHPPSTSMWASRALYPELYLGYHLDNDMDDVGSSGSMFRSTNELAFEVEELDDLIEPQWMAGEADTTPPYPAMHDDEHIWAVPQRFPEPPPRSRSSASSSSHRSSACTSDANSSESGSVSVSSPSPASPIIKLEEEASIPLSLSASEVEQSQNSFLYYRGGKHASTSRPSGPQDIHLAVASEGEDWKPYPLVWPENLSPLTANDAMAGEEVIAGPSNADPQAIGAVISLTPAGTIICRWEGCGMAIPYTEEDISKHVEEHCELKPSDDPTKSAQMVECKWEGCRHHGTPIQRASFLRHVLVVHTTLRKVICDRCGKRLSRNDSDRRHTKVCLRCKSCQVSFETKDALKVHVCPKKSKGKGKKRR